MSKVTLNESKYKKYPEYKDSGSKWLDEIPTHWKVTSLKHVLSTPITDGPHLTPVKRNKGIPFISAEAVSQGYINFDKKWGYISKEDDELFTRKYSPQMGDVYMIKSGATTGITAIVETDEQFNIWSPLAVMRCKSTYNPYFLLNYLRSDSFQKSVQLSWTFGTQQNIGMNTLENLTVCYPPSEEQSQIANFLDHETAKIDTLIDKQQQLISLLKEKRQAVISHAVTRGLNPDAPMKDSGVEWLGEVPAHWGVSKLKYIVKEPLLYGANEAALNTDKSCPRFIRITDVLPNGLLKKDTFRSLPEEIALPYMLSDGDILLARSGGTVGKSFIYNKSWGRCCFAGYLIKASVDESVISADWVYMNTLTSFYWDWISSSQIKATIQNVSAEKYNSFSIAMPPKEETQEILSYLQQKLEMFDGLEEKASSAISLIQERRTALISAAVTGKIDVRHFTLENGQPLISNQEAAMEANA